jgi:hypothetical protein
MLIIMSVVFNDMWTAQFKKTYIANVPHLCVQFHRTATDKPCTRLSNRKKRDIYPGDPRFL